MSVDGSVVPIQVVQISPEEGGIVLEKVLEEGAHVKKGDVIIRLNNSNLDLQILNAESEAGRETEHAAQHAAVLGAGQPQQPQRGFAGSRWTYRPNGAPSTTSRLCTKRSLNSREEYLKAKEDYELAVQKNELIQQRLAKTREL